MRRQLFGYDNKKKTHICWFNVRECLFGVFTDLFAEAKRWSIASMDSNGAMRVSNSSVNLERLYYTKEDYGHEIVFINGAKPNQCDDEYLNINISESDTSVYIIIYDFFLFNIFQTLIVYV